jgi:hypothetical protein
MANVAAEKASGAPKRQWTVTADGSKRSAQFGRSSTILLPPSSCPLSGSVASSALARCFRSQIKHAGQQRIVPNPADEGTATQTAETPKTQSGKAATKGLDTAECAEYAEKGMAGSPISAYSAYSAVSALGQFHSQPAHILGYCSAEKTAKLHLCTAIVQHVRRLRGNFHAARATGRIQERAEGRSESGIA